MKHTFFMEGLESSSYVDHSFPDLALLDFGMFSSMGMNHSKEVSLTSEFHDDVKNSSVVIIKGLFEVNDVFTLLRGKDADLIESIVSVFLFDASHPNLCNGSGTFFIAY